MKCPCGCPSFPWCAETSYQIRSNYDQVLWGLKRPYNYLCTSRRLPTVPVWEFVFNPDQWILRGQVWIGGLGLYDHSCFGALTALDDQHISSCSESTYQKQTQQPWRWYLDGTLQCHRSWSNITSHSNAYLLFSSTIIHFQVSRHHTSCLRT